MNNFIRTNITKRLMHENVQKVLDIMLHAGIDIDEYKKYSQDYSKIPLSLVSKIGNKVDLDEEVLLKGGYDFDCLSDKLINNEASLPQRYKLYSYSKLDTIRNVLSILEKSSPYFVDFLKKRLQIKDLIETKNSMNIGPLLLQDIMSYMGKWKFNLDSFKCLGRKSGEQYLDVLLHDARDSYSLAQIYEYAIEKVDSEVEKNFSYKIIKKNVSSITISAKPRRELIEELGNDTFFSIKHCYNVIGWIEVVAEKHLKQPINVNKNSCYHAGDCSCTYEVSLRYIH